MSETPPVTPKPPPPAKQRGTAQVWKAKVLAKPKDPVERTNHVKRVVAICGVGVALVFIAILVHGPNKRHPAGETTAQQQNTSDDNSTPSLAAYRQQLDAARRRADQDNARNTANGQAPLQSGTGDYNHSDDAQDLAYVRQGWQQQFKIDVGAGPGAQAGNGAGSGAGSDGQYNDTNRQRAEDERRLHLALQRQRQLQLQTRSYGGVQ